MAPEQPESKPTPAHDPSSDPPASGSPEDAAAGTESPPSPDSAAAEPTVEEANVVRMLLYGLSLPERAIRSTSAAVGGAVHESAELLIPGAFRNSKSYSIFVQQALDFMMRDVGGVAADDEEAAPTMDAFVARKTAGSVIELAGWATLHISPVTVLAIVSDVAYGSQSYLKELSVELKKQGVIAEDSTIDHSADLLEAIKDFTATTSQAFDTPPLSVDGLRETIEETRTAASSMDLRKALPQAEIQRLWDEMRTVAGEQDVGILDISSAVALQTVGRIGRVGRGTLSTVRVAGTLLDRHVLEHYSEGVNDIRERGFYTVFSEASRPYLEAVWENFSVDRGTITEDLLSGRMFGKAWKWWKGRRRKNGPSEGEADETGTSEADA